MSICDQCAFSPEAIFGETPSGDGDGDDDGDGDGDQCASPEAIFGETRSPGSVNLPEGGQLLKSSQITFLNKKYLELGFWLFTHNPRFTFGSFGYCVSFSLNCIQLLKLDNEKNNAMWQKWINNKHWYVPPHDFCLIVFTLVWFCWRVQRANNAWFSLEQNFQLLYMWWIKFSLFEWFPISQLFVRWICFWNKTD